MDEKKMNPPNGTTYGVIPESNTQIPETNEWEENPGREKKESG